MKRKHCIKDNKCLNHTHEGIGRFLSSYIEAVGSYQEIATNQNIAFDISEDYIDNVGNNFQISNDGKTFTITRPGLYHVEWSLNFSTSNPGVLVGLLENGIPSSAMSCENTQGNLSSGALINVETIPYTISLHNFGTPINLVNLDGALNTAVSIRILRFANGST